MNVTLKADEDYVYDSSPALGHQIEENKLSMALRFDSFSLFQTQCLCMVKIKMPRD